MNAYIFVCMSVHAPSDANVHKRETVPLLNVIRYSLFVNGGKINIQME